MSEHLQSDDKRLNDQLAAFTDHLLASEGEVILSSDQELRELQETVIQMKNMQEKTQPSQAMADRMRANLVTEWHNLDTQDAPESLGERVRKLNPFHQRSWRSTSASQRTLALSFAVVAAVVLAAAVLLLPQINTELTATAIGSFGFGFLFISLGIAAILVFLWLLRSKG